MADTSCESVHLRERIAKTLRSADLEEGERHVVPWADLPEDNDDRLDYLRLADAVLSDLGIERDGWLYRPFGHNVWRHTPVDQDWDYIGRQERLEHHAVFRLSDAAFGGTGQVGG